MMRTVWAVSIIWAGAVVGCSTAGEYAGVPRAARLVDERPERVAFVAGEPGAVYVRDVAADEVVFTRALAVGQTVEACGERLTVDGQSVGATGLRADAMYQVFFVPRN
ncbi:MAG: hypothetical protein ACAI43_22325 [Phycisphaerae bacterium]|nr:hypothetical protein [Tepidisphaeraceae bacterium]